MSTSSVYLEVTQKLCQLDQHTRLRVHLEYQMSSNPEIRLHYHISSDIGHLPIV